MTTSIRSHPLGRIRRDRSKPPALSVSAESDSIVTLLWNPGYVPLLRFIAERGPSTVREIRREFPGVDLGQLYRTLRTLRRWGWVLLDSDPITARLAPGGVRRFADVLDRWRPSTVAAAEFDELLFRLEVEAMLRPQLDTSGAATQLRLFLAELMGGIT